ncbi:phage tail protein [Streptomyces murinus]|uniref:phage tail protein n=1 Tax=Streptomyces murinus TaxID=33900 RepID=UPI0038262029
MTQPLPHDALALPVVFAKDTVMQEFAAAVAQLLVPYDQALDDLPRLLDSWRTDPEWLDWLSWASGAPDGTSWPDASRRAAIESAALLAAARGTLQALKSEAELLGWELSIADPGGVAVGEASIGPRQPLVVSLAWSPADEAGIGIARSRLEQMVERNCPAHVPWRVLVTEGFWPGAGLCLPDKQRAFFFYGPAAGGDQVVDYDFTARSPMAPPSDLEQQIARELQHELLSETGVDAAAWHELGFLIVSGDTVFLWDMSVGKFTVRKDLGAIFPVEEQQQSNGVDDILTVRSDTAVIYYVFRGEYCYRYSFDRIRKFHEGERSGDRYQISELYTDLPTTFQRDLDAVIEDPRRPGIHYLLSGPECAEIDGFTYLKTHFIRDLWPGLPVRSSGGGVGGGLIKIASNVHVCGHPLAVTYLARRQTSGAQLQIYPDPSVSYEERNTLPAPGPHCAVETMAQSGSVLFESEAVDSPGIYTLYYTLPALKTWLADPVSFTALLETPDGILQLASEHTKTTHIKRDAVTFQFETRYKQNAAIVVYRASTEEVPQEPHTLESVRKIQVPQDRGTVPGGDAYPPGDYTAYLVARGGFAWLAKPLSFTATLSASELGTLAIGDADQDAEGLVPGGHSFLIMYNPNPDSAGHVWAQGSINIYRQDQEGPAKPRPDTLPQGSPIATQESDLRVHPTTMGSLPPGGYSAYFCASKDSTAWLAERKRFTVSVPRLGNLNIIDPGQNGAPIILSYSTDYPDLANKIAAFEFIEGESSQGPLLNTDITDWEGLRCDKPAADRAGTTSLTAQDLATPGDYCVFFVSDGGGELAHPVTICSTLSSDQYGKIEFRNPEHDAITTDTPIDLQLTTSYPHIKNRLSVCPGGASLVRPPNEIFAAVLESGTVTIPAQILTPGKYTAYFTARNSSAFLAEPATFLVNAAITSDDYIKSQEVSYLQGMNPPPIIEYRTRFSQESDYDDSENKIHIERTSDTGSFEPRSYPAKGSSGSVAVDDLPIGDYIVQFFGKDDSRLAKPIKFSVTPRTVKLILQDMTCDAWKALSLATVIGCTVTNPVLDIPASSAPDTPGMPVSVTFTQSPDTVFPTSPTGIPTTIMTGTLPYTHAEYQQPVTLSWIMQQNGQVTYSAQTPTGCSVRLLSASPEEDLSGTNGLADQDPEASIALYNKQHRSTSVILHNMLTTQLTLVRRPEPENAKFADEGPLDTIAASDQDQWCSTVIVSGDDSSGEVSYAFTPSGKPELTLTLAWTSPAEGKKPTYEVTLPAGVTMKVNQTMWDITPV